MKRLLLIIIIISFLFSINTVFAQKKVKNKSPKLTEPLIINGIVGSLKSINLPGPEYPKAARFVNVSGAVSVEILIGENGNVEKAKVVSGHLLLRSEAVKTALKTKFEPFKISGNAVKVRGFIVYNFVDYLSVPESDSEPKKIKTISLGVLNDKAKILPLPKTPNAQIRITESVNVEVKIDLQKGEVVSASAVSGHPLLRMPAEIAAKQAKFEPILTEFPTVYGTGILIYKIEDFTGKIIENENPKAVFPPISGGILNGKARNPEKPEYPKEAENFCVSGKVEVAVIIYDATGEVIAAKAISGNRILWKSAEEAVLKTKFSPTLFSGSNDFYVSGKIVYNFISKQKCINGGIVNTRANYLPKPQVGNLNQPKHLQIRKDEIVIVQIIVDLSGNVTNAKAVSGHPLLRSACEFSARQTKFAPTLITGGTPFKINAWLVYKFKSDGTIDTQIERDDKDVVGLPVNLVEPPPPFCNCRFGGNSSVIVQVEIDKKGNVSKATAISGHPILKLSSEKAALESKFIPANVKVKKYIRYDFEEINKYSVKISSVEMAEIESNK